MATEETQPLNTADKPQMYCFMTVMINRLVINLLRCSILKLFSLESYQNDKRHFKVR